MEKITLIAQLFLYPDQDEAYHQFETTAAQVMTKHGGEITRRFVLTPPKEAGTPDEIHIVTFPNKQAFEAYRVDEEIITHAALRASTIRKTIVWKVQDADLFI